MRGQYRPSGLFGSAAVSAIAFMIVVVGWARSYPHTGVCGLHNTVRESSATLFAIDSYTVQGHNGQVWFGRCRFSVIAPQGFKDGGAGRLEKIGRNLGVFTFDGEPSPVRGVGWVSAEVTRNFGDGSRVVYGVDGMLLPSWLLALVSGLLPAVWIGRTVRRMARLHNTLSDESGDGDSPSW
jgi:hypothetical protein